VLGFQAILGIQIVFLSLFLIGAQTLWQAIVQLVAIGLLGWLFWKLIRAMARLQIPERRPTQEGR
jgi:threonine/homoserine/homoserine lactone efflux protein